MYIQKTSSHYMSCKNPLFYFSVSMAYEFLSLLLVTILAFNGVTCFDMDDDERFGLFEVMGSLLDDPSWARTHPSPCTDTPWPGVLECELQDQTTTFHVTKIHLGPDVLTPPCKPSAKISPSLSKLPYLKTLSLISCFTGPPLFLNESLLGPMPYLAHLSLHSNPGLTGEIPSTVSSNLAALKTLRLSQNNLVGPIPREIGGLANLQHLDLGHNSLTGPIPEEIGNLSSLAVLDFSWNFLAGKLSSSVGGLELLEKIDLSRNGLRGNLPRELGGLSRLVLLDLSRNSLTGEIPEEFSGLERLEYLIMDGNPLNAGFPAFSGSSLVSLTVLSLSGCGLTGPIRTTFSGSTNLTTLSLDDNRLNGSVPAGLGLLPRLDTLNLSRNRFVGELLFSRELVTRLGERLDIRGNSGLCTDYVGDAETTSNGSARFSKNPVCSSSIFGGKANKSLSSEYVKPKVLESSNGCDVDKMSLVRVLFVCLLITFCILGAQFEKYGL